jgi:hypothetical protein
MVRKELMASSFRDGPNGSALAPPDDRVRTRPQMRNCASGNLEIPGAPLRVAPE